MPGRHDGPVQGYHDHTYGDAFADVYDDWYADLGDLDTAVATLAELADLEGVHSARVLELGVGTGRLAIPLAARVGEVIGVDASRPMLDVLAGKPGGELLHLVHGDMVDDVPPGPFDLVFAAYNTLFNLRTAQRQRQCIASVAHRLRPGGRFVVEAFVPTDDGGRTSAVDLRTMTADRVVLSVSRSDPATQLAEGQYVELTHGGGVRLRPWSIRWASPAQLDDMAAAAGLHLDARWGGFDRSPFRHDGDRHVSVYRTTM